jgi:anthranilate synthase component 1
MWPDVDFSFPGATLICDHLRHSTTVVVNAVIDDGQDPTGVFHDSIKQLDEIIDVLIAPAPEGDPDTERLVASAPTLRHQIEIRSIAAGLSNFTKESYGATVQRAKEYIHLGDVFQVVPSQQSTGCCALLTRRPTCTCSTAVTTRSWAPRPRCSCACTSAC